MTLDEAIAHAREVAEENFDLAQDMYFSDEDTNERNKCLNCTEEHDQLAEWLEELKAYKELGTVEECKNAILNIERFYQFGYNKAIDDFAEILFFNTSEFEVMNGFGEIEDRVNAIEIKKVYEIAQQLKDGGTDERV